MADKSAKTRSQLSRLQRRAPASIQVTPASQWNAAIPLLSPLVTSPEVKKNCSSKAKGVVNSDNKIVLEPEKGPVVYNKWLHPAAPFYYEPAPVPALFQSVCTGGVDRR